MPYIYLGVNMGIPDEALNFRRPAGSPGDAALEQRALEQTLEEQAAALRDEVQGQPAVDISNPQFLIPEQQDPNAVFRPPPTLNEQLNTQFLLPEQQEPDAVFDAQAASDADGGEFNPDATFGERFFNDRGLGGERRLIGGNNSNAIPVITGDLTYPNINLESIYNDFANPRDGVCNFIEFKVFSKKAQALNFEYNSLTDFELGFGDADKPVTIGTDDFRSLLNQSAVRDEDSEISLTENFTREAGSEYFYSGLKDIRERIQGGDQQAKRQFVDLVSKDIRAGKATEQVGETIRMYFPNEFQNTDRVEYQDVNLNFFQGIVEAFGGAGAANFGSLVGSRAISELIGGASRLGSALLPGVGGQELGGQVQGGIQAKVGFVENPKNESLFKGVNRKTFNMSFTFAPRTEEESHIAVNIIEAFRFHMLPELSLTTTFLLTPNEFEVTLLTLDLDSGQFVRNPALPNPGRCFLINTDVNYSPNPKSAFFRNGVPCQMNLTLQFAQAFIMNKQLVLGGF